MSRRVVYAASLVAWDWIESISAMLVWQWTDGRRADLLDLLGWTLWTWLTVDGAIDRPKFKNSHNQSSLNQRTVRYVSASPLFRLLHHNNILCNPRTNPPALLACSLLLHHHAIPLKKEIARVGDRHTAVRDATSAAEPQRRLPFYSQYHRIHAGSVGCQFLVFYEMASKVLYLAVYCVVSS